MPTARTLNNKLNAWEYPLRKVTKSKPKKKVPKTDAIFEEIHRVNAAADAAQDTLRISMDAKATVKIGEYSRGGYNRFTVAATDHDFHPEAMVTPFGFVLPKLGDLFSYLSTSKVISDFIVDSLDDLWSTVLHPRFPLVQTLALNQDNGPENTTVGEPSFRIG